MRRNYVINFSIIIVVCLILTPLSIDAVPLEKIIDSNENGHLSDDPPYLPFPGDLIDDAPIFQSLNIHRNDKDHHKININSQDDLIIEILLQLNESFLLEYLEELVDFGPRVTGTSACEEAGEYIYSEFKTMGLEVRYHNWSYGSYSGSNIEATLEGINESSDEIYLICAHYDSVPGSPGADDDGSGTVAVIAAAEVLSMYASNHTIRFVAFSGEEQGLLGSSVYAQEAYQNGDNIVGVLNGDMIGFAITTNDGDNIKIYENTESTWITYLTEEISGIYDEYIGLNIVPSGSSSGSDHYSFWQNDYDAIFYHEYNFNDYYHSPEDTIENMNMTYDNKSTRLMIATLAVLAQSHIPSEPPAEPTITGPSTGVEKEVYEYNFTTTDPENHDVYYYIDWGDETNSGWIGPYSSGEKITTTHSWVIEGDYEITAKAKDIFNIQSEWSEPYPITILSGPNLNIKSVKGGFFKINSIIENSGGLDANDVNWSIELSGGAIIGRETIDIIDIIPAGEEMTVISKPIIGFGKTSVRVETWIADSSDSQEVGGFVLLFYINVNPGGSL